MGTQHVPTLKVVVSKKSKSQATTDKVKSTGRVSAAVAQDVHSFQPSAAAKAPAALAAKGSGRKRYAISSSCLQSLLLALFFCVASVPADNSALFKISKSLAFLYLALCHWAEAPVSCHLGNVGRRLWTFPKRNGSAERASESCGCAKVMRSCQCVQALHFQCRATGTCGASWWLGPK